MAGTTPERGYPFPHDSDLINVAFDIELLAQAVDADVESIRTSGSNMDALQNAEILGLKQNVDANYATEKADHLAQEQQILGIKQNMDANYEQQVIVANIVSVHEIRLDEMSGGPVTISERVTVSLDGNGFGSVFFPTDTFAAGSIPVVLAATQDHAGGNPALWIETQVTQVLANGFGVQFMVRGTNTPASGSITFGYIAVGAGT
jgi:hypothetical protein